MALLPKWAADHPFLQNHIKLTVDVLKAVGHPHPCPVIERFGIWTWMVVYYSLQLLTLLEYLDGGDDEFYEDEGNGSIQFLRLAANSIQERCQPKILVLSISYLVSVC